MATAEGTRPQRTALGTLVSAAKARDTQPPKATDRSSRAVAHCYNRKKPQLLTDMSNYVEEYAITR